MPHNGILAGLYLHYTWPLRLDSRAAYPFLPTESSPAPSHLSGCEMGSVVEVTEEYKVRLAFESLSSGGPLRSLTLCIHPPGFAHIRHQLHIWIHMFPPTLLHNLLVRGDAAANVFLLLLSVRYRSRPRVALGDSYIFFIEAQKPKRFHSVHMKQHIGINMIIF